MSLRAAIHSLLTVDPIIPLLGLDPDDIHGSTSLESPDNTKPFLTQRWGEAPVLNNVGTGYPLRTAPSRRNALQLWVYDAPGDYDRIDSIIAYIRDQLFASVAALGFSDGWITQIDWTGDGEDLYDDTYDAILRTTSYQVIASGR